MLIPLFLFEKGILNKPLFYISAYFEADRESYYSKLNSITSDNNWEQWVEYFLSGVIFQAKKNVLLAKEILLLYDKLKSEIMDLTGSKYSIRILDFLFEKPVFTSTDFLNYLGANRAVVRRNIEKLAAENIISPLERGTGTKATVYRFSRLLEITDTPVI